MLNKDEKRNIGYIIEYLKTIREIYFEMDEKYEMEEYFESCDFCHQTLMRKRIPAWKPLSDIHSIVLKIETILENIRQKRFVRESTYEDSKKYRDKKHKKEKELIEKGIKRGEKLATKRYEYLKLRTLGHEIKKEGKLYRKAYNEGFERAKKTERLTDKQILNKAKQIELEIKLGFRKEDD